MAAESEDFGVVALLDGVFDEGVEAVGSEAPVFVFPFNGARLWTTLPLP